MGMTGPDRARLYALALGTGLRASELASLTPERFDLSTDPPTATVSAAYLGRSRLPIGRTARKACSPSPLPWPPGWLPGSPRWPPAAPSSPCPGEDGRDDHEGPEGRRHPLRDALGRDRLPRPPRRLRQQPRGVGRVRQDLPGPRAA